MDDRLDTISDAIWNLKEAADYIRELGNHGCDVDTLEDIIDGLKKEREALEVEDDKRRAQDTQDMTDEYWRSVL